MLISNQRNQIWAELNGDHHRWRTLSMSVVGIAFSFCCFCIQFEFYSMMSQVPDVPGLVSIDPWLQPFTNVIKTRYGSDGWNISMNDYPGLVYVIFSMQKFLQLKQNIENNEPGGLEGFTQSFKKYGFNREVSWWWWCKSTIFERFNVQGNCLVYREWAPGAQRLSLCGDFSMWLVFVHEYRRWPVLFIGRRWLESRITYMPA